jgi:hypothetical protein
MLMTFNNSGMAVAFEDVAIGVDRPLAVDRHFGQEDKDSKLLSGIERGMPSISIPCTLQQISRRRPPSRLGRKDTTG